jgi:hypothetical protein
MPPMPPMPPPGIAGGSRINRWGAPAIPAVEVGIRIGTAYNPCRARRQGCASTLFIWARKSGADCARQKAWPMTDSRSDFGCPLVRASALDRNAFLGQRVRTVPISTETRRRRSVPDWPFGIRERNANDSQRWSCSTVDSRYHMNRAPPRHLSNKLRECCTPAGR